MVWIFQEGHLASVLGVSPAPLNPSMVVLLCAIAFSLSVDYEIFLLSRIKEARDSGLDNNASTVIGLGRVGRIVTSAALLLTITLISFANGLSFMKMFGIGTALAVVIDASIIRGVVVPAFLRVAATSTGGRRNRCDGCTIALASAKSRPGSRKSYRRWNRQRRPRLHLPLGGRGAGGGPSVTDEKTVEEPIPSGPSPTGKLTEVEVIPGRHLVANVKGTVIVVAHRDREPLSQESLAAQQLAALVDMVRNTSPQKLVTAFQRIAREPWDRTMVDVGIIMPTSTGLEILLCGAVTVTLDDGADRTVLRGRGRLVHRSVPTPRVATVITVDELGQRSHASPV